MTADFQAQPGTHHLDLAQWPEFDIGPLHVSPARRRVTQDGRSSELEPRVMRVLVVLAAASPGVVSRDQLVETCWDGRIVGDDAVNRCILALRNLARSHDPEPFAIETVRGVGYSLVPNGPSRMPASASGLRAAAPSPDDEPVAAQPPRRRRLAVVASIALGVIVVAGALAWAGWRTLRPASGAGAVASIDILPFRPLHGDAELARISVATGDAVVRVLRGAGISVENIPGAGAVAPEADFHLQGTVDRDGDALVVNAQVLDRDRRTVLWSGRLERPLAAPAGFSDEAANRIGDVVYCGLESRAASNRPMSDPVLALLLQACEFRRGGPDDAPRFLAAAERLRDAAPQLSRAQSLYAIAAAAQSFIAPDAPQAPAWAAAARAAAHRALQLDPKNGEAYFAIGASYGVDRAWSEREANYLRAEALSPGFGFVRDLHVELLREVGRIAEARNLNRRTVGDDPFSVDQLDMLILMTSAADGPDDAEPLIRRLAAQASPAEVANARLTTRFWWGDPKTALRLLKGDDVRSTGLNQGCLVDYLSALLQPGSHRGLPASCGDVQADWRVRMLAREGDIDGAYREIAETPPRWSMLIGFFYPEMRAFRADPRFMPLAARYGLVDYWIRSGRWPDFCRARDRPYDCAAVARSLKIATGSPRARPE